MDDEALPVRRTPNRVIESITECKTATGWSVRVWWKRATFEDCFVAGVHTPIIEAIRANAANPETIRAAVEGLEGAAENLADIEIKDARGNGACIYPDWP